MPNDVGDHRRQPSDSGPGLHGGTVYRFDDFELDPTGPTLRRGGTEIHLRHKTFHVLLYLVEQRHRCVPKQELWQQVWAASAVTEDTLVQSVKDIRRALGDDVRSPRYVRTFPRIGYRFVADVEERPRPQPLPPPPPGPLPHDSRDPSQPHRVDGSTPAAASTWLTWRWAVVLVCFASLVLAGAYAAYRLTGAGSLAAGREDPRPTTLLITYFENQSADAEVSWLRHGLPDMLGSGLARSEDIVVVTRAAGEQSGSAGGGGAPVPLDRSLALARRRGANAVLTGSFARLGERLRVDVRVYDAASGDLLAADSLVADRIAQVLSEVDLLSLRLASRFGGGTRPSPSLPEVMTDNLDAYRFYSLGVERAHALQNVEALQLFERAVALDPGFAMAHARIGYTYAAMWGRNDEAKPHLQRAFNLSSRLTPRDRLSIAAWYAIANYDYAEAVRLYRQILAAYPGDTEPYLRLAVLLIGEGQPQEALDVVLRGLTIDPASPQLHNVRAAAHEHLHQYDRAIEAARRYVELAPHEPNPYDSLSLHLVSVGDYAGAKAALQRALAIDPRFEIARIHLANVYYREGRYADAIAEIRTYIDHAPSEGERVRGLDTLAEIHRRLGRDAEADRYLAEATRLHPMTRLDHVLAAIRRGDVAFAERAKRELEGRRSPGRGSRVTPRFRLYELGTISLHLGQHEEAVAAFREAIASPAPRWNFEDMETCLGDALVHVGRYEEAVAEYERILRVNPHYALARYGLARAYEGAGRAESAVRQYARFLETWHSADPGVPQVIDARRRLAALTTPDEGPPIRPS
ncbi:MAG TPA: tetratricopeptide repeat protein [Vicinamibacterales bacterium]|nr:tetratricopeptide repeat protein [Vicinamibacterales bacterium]